MKFTAAALSAILLLPVAALAQNGLTAPYAAAERTWATPAAGAEWGASAGIERGPRGEVWAIDRCGANSCDGSDRNPLVLLDMTTGKPIRSMDRSSNVWVTDGGIAKDGKTGLQVMKLSPRGEVLLRLGTAGQRGNDAVHFQAPSDVITAPNGDIFVADGHGPVAGTIPAGMGMRIMKFDRNGKFLMQWGSAGAGKGEFNTPHALALDARGRLFVADRSNNRIQIFTQGGRFIAEWKQFGRPSGFHIVGDRLHVADSESTEANHPGWKKGIWIGSIARSLPDAFVPDEQAGEGVMVTPDGNLYGAVNAAPRGITRYLKK
jgi:hypothetical protein